MAIQSDRRAILQTQATHALMGALGAAEARVYGQEPAHIMGVVHVQDGDVDTLTTRQTFHEIHGDQLRCIEYETNVTVTVYRTDRGPS